MVSVDVKHHVYLLKICWAYFPFCTLYSCRHKYIATDQYPDIYTMASLLMTAKVLQHFAEAAGNPFHSLSPSSCCTVIITMCRQSWPITQKIRTWDSLPPPPPPPPTSWRLKYKNENSTINPCSPPYTSILNGWHNLAPRPPLFQKSHTCPKKGMYYLEQNPQGLLGWINQSWSWNLWRWKQMFIRQLTNLVHKIIQLRCLKTHKSCHSHIR